MTHHRNFTDDVGRRDFLKRLAVAARRGLRVIMTEETDWIGGQLTQQAVPPDKTAWIETIGGTRSYLALRTGMRNDYRAQTPLTARA